MPVQDVIEQLAPPPTGEVCAACGRVIGHLEQPYVWDENIVCFGCHRDRSTSADSAAPCGPERTIHADADNVVTKSHVTLSGVTYPLSEIRFARMKKVSPRRAYGSALAAAGAVVALFGTNRHPDHLDILLLVAGAILLLVGSAAALLPRTRYLVLLTCNEGETVALASTRAGYVRQLLDAIAEAIVERGQLPTGPAPAPPTPSRIGR